MIINDLTFMESVAEEVVGGFSFTAEKDVDIDVLVTETIDIDKDVDVDVDISGNLATAEAGATAFGENTLAEAFGFTYTDDGTSAANAFSVAATY